jgi:hypothetical protein
MPIMQDSTFVRIVADRALPIDLGLDIELAFLQFSQSLKSITQKEDHEAWEMVANITEVVRVRLTRSSALDLAMQIIKDGILSDSVKGVGVARAVVKWTEEAKSTDSGSQTDAA